MPLVVARDGTPLALAPPADASSPVVPTKIGRALAPRLGLARDEEVKVSRVQCEVTPLGADGATLRVTSLGANPTPWFPAAHAHARRLIRKGEEATLGWLVCACQSLWVPTMLAYRAGWLTNFTVALPVLFFGCFNWAHFIFYMRMMRIPMKPRIATGGVCGLAFFLHPAVTTIGQPAEGLLVFCSLLSGELFGYAFEARTAAGKLELEQRSQQLINHAAKRVASNAAQSCMLVLAKLEEIDSDDPAQRARARAEAEDLLRACWAGSVQGFHACKAALLHKSLKKKEYWSQKNESLDTFTPDALLSALGVRTPPKLSRKAIWQTFLPIGTFHAIGHIAGTVGTAAGNSSSIDPTP